MESRKLTCGVYLYSEEEQLYVSYRNRLTRAASQTDQDEQYQELYCRGREGGRSRASLILFLTLLHMGCNYLDGQRHTSTVVCGNRVFVICSPRVCSMGFFVVGCMFSGDFPFRLKTVCSRISRCFVTVSSLPTKFHSLIYTL